MGNKEGINIQHPEVWELLVSIDDKRVSYILYTPTVANSLVTGEVSRTDDSLQGLEDAVYDTPALLNDYRQVSVIVYSRHFVLFPEDMADDDCLSLLQRAFPDDNGDAAVCALPANGVKIAYMMPAGLQAFMGRTFNYPKLYHHLYPLCEHFMDLNQCSDKSRMFLNLNAESMDLAIYRDAKLQCANTYPYNNPQDAAYFALNAWRAYGLDQLTDELQLTGDSEVRAAMTPVLRDYVKHVMPASFPAAAMALGRNAMQAPLELILLAL